MAGKIHPGRLLYTLKVLLSPSGGIKSSFEVDRLVPLMEKFSRKLVSRIVYINILQASSPELLRMFLSRKGWNLVCLWFSGATRNNNVPLRIKLLNLLLLCPSPPESSSSTEMIKSIQQLTKNLKQIEMSVLALQVLANWGMTQKDDEEEDKTVTSLLQNLKTCVNEKIGAKTPTENICKNQTEVDASRRFKSFVRVSVQLDSTAIIEEKANKSNVSNMNLITLKWDKCEPRESSRTPQLLDEKLNSSKTSHSTSKKCASREPDVNSNLVSKKKPYSIPRHSGSSKYSIKRENTDFNENYPRKKLCSEAKERKRSKTEMEVSCEVDKTSDKRVEFEEPVKNHIEEFKKRRKEELSRRHKKEAEFLSKISFKTEYKRDFDQESKKRVKDVVNALKNKTPFSGDKKSVSKNIPSSNNHPPSSGPISSLSVSKPEIVKKNHEKCDSVVSSNILATDSNKLSKSSKPNSILGIRPLTPIESSSTETDKNIKETNEIKFCQSSLKEVNLFGSDEFNHSNPPKLKLKSKKAFTHKIPVTKRGNSHTKISPARTSPAQIEAIKSKKTVSWAAGDKLVNARYFDVVREERTNVCRQKFEERRKNEAKKEKLKLKGTQFQTSVVGIPAPLPPLNVGPSTISTLPPFSPKFENRKSRSRRWPGLVRLEHRLKIRYGRKSEEKNIQKLREAETPTFHWNKLNLCEPSEVDFTTQQRRSMVVSIRSIHNDDISGEGTSIDFSLIDWPQQVLQGPSNCGRSLSKLSSVRSFSSRQKNNKVPVQCIFWARGFCKNEGKCRFLHEPVNKEVPLMDTSDDKAGKKSENE